jgi:hypothetical protein
MRRTPKFSDVCMILMTADNDGTGCGALAAAEQVQSKIVLLDGENLHFDWCLFGASNKDGADLKTGTDFVMSFIWCWWRLLFQCNDLFS